MKRLYIFVLLIFCSFFGGSNGYAKSQKSVLLKNNCHHPTSEEILLVDTTTYHVGRLRNGLTYYIVRNEIPRARAEFYLVTKVGSAKEEDEQRGAAHLIEHQAISRNLSRNRHYGGTTSLLYTSYNVSNVNTRNEIDIDSALFTLFDWSHNVTFEPVEFERNRRIICAEVIARESQVNKLNKKALLQKLNGTYYQFRPDQGSVADIQKLTLRSAVDFYHNWYVPELQAIIVTGSVDVDMIERKIREIFGAIPESVSKKQAELYLPEYPNFKSSKIVIEADTITNQTQLYLSFMQSPKARHYLNTRQWHRLQPIYTLIRNMLVERLNDQIHDAGLHECQYIVNYAPQSNRLFCNPEFECIYQGQTTFWRKQLRFMIHEIERIDKFGFTEAEFHNHILKYRQWIVRQQSELQRRNSNEYVTDCINHFLYGSSLNNLNNFYTQMSMILDSITLTDVNRLYHDIVHNRTPRVTAIIHSNSSDGVPSVDELGRLINTYQHEKVLSQVDSSTPDSIHLECILPDTMPKLIKVDTLEMQIVRLTLSNNVRIIKKYSDAHGQIFTRGFLRGGKSALPEKLFFAATYIGGDYANQVGYGLLSPAQVRQWNSEQSIENTSLLSSDHLEIKGQCHSYNFKNYLQSLFLSLTAVNTDTIIVRQQMNSLHDRSLLVRNNIEVSQEGVYNNLCNLLPYNADKLPEPEQISQAWQQATKNFNGFTFVVVGNLDDPNIDSLLVNYLGNLPSNTDSPVEQQLTSHTPETDTNITYTTAMPSHVSRTSLYYCLDTMAYTNRNKYLMELVEKELGKCLTDALRHELGLVYNVSTRAILTAFNRPQATLCIEFSSHPDSVQHICSVIDTLLHHASSLVIPSNTLKKYSVSQLLSLVNKTRDPRWWLTRLYDTNYTGVDMYNVNSKIINSLTSSDVSSMFNYFATDGRRIRITGVGK